MSTAEVPQFEIIPPSEIDVPETDLHLRLFKDSDAEDLLELVSNDSVQRYVPWAKRINDLESAHESVKRFEKAWQDERRARYVVEKDGEFVGYAGIWSDPKPGFYEFGFAMLPTFRNQGIGTKTITQLMEVAKNNLHAKGMVAYVDDANEPSKAVVTSLGLNPLDEIDQGDRRYELNFN